MEVDAQVVYPKAQRPWKDPREHHAEARHGPPRDHESYETQLDIRVRETESLEIWQLLPPDHEGLKSNPYNYGHSQGEHSSFEIPVGSNQASEHEFL